MSINVSRISTQQKQGIISDCHKQLNKIGQITLENVSKADETTRQYLRNYSPARLKELAKMNCHAADKIKNELDKKFGKDNYTLIAVGRSISSIAELLGKIGVDTKIIPLSGLRRCNVNNISQDNLHTYKTFLVQIGLSKTDLEKNKNKTYILMDYTYYGRSLKRAEELLKKDELLGNAPNLISMPVSNVLGDDYKDKGYKTLFECCRFKDYSYVGKLHIDELDKVFECCSPERIKDYKGNITQGLRNLFWFNVYDSLNKFNNITPRKELNALYEHHFSTKAMKNYVKREQQKQTLALQFIKGLK